MTNSNWEFSRQPLHDFNGERFWVTHQGAIASYRHALEAMQGDESFQDTLTKTLQTSPYAAARWETPPVSQENIQRPFEFVLIDDPWLQGKTDTHTFREHFREDDEVVTFHNLGRDATLVVPCPIPSADGFAHLLSFVRNAVDSQIRALWSTVANAMRARVGNRPVWLSTAGGGVAYLHVRLDDMPKYYVYPPYRHWQTSD